jgi:hypothetical protein
MGGSATAVAATRAPDGNVEVFITDDDGRLQVRRQLPSAANGWTDWRDIDERWASFTIRQIAAARSGGAVVAHGADAEGLVFRRVREQIDPDLWGLWAPSSITVRPSVPVNEAPLAASPGDFRTELGTPVSLRLTETGGVTWTLQGLPPGLTGSSDGLITGFRSRAAVRRIASRPPSPT